MSYLLWVKESVRDLNLSALFKKGKQPPQKMEGNKDLTTVACGKSFCLSL
jgi:hypothetical protein